MNDMILKALDIYIIRGTDAKKDVEQILETVWVCYDWQFFSEYANHMSTVLAELVRELVVDEENAAKALRNANLIRELLR